MRSTLKVLLLCAALAVTALPATATATEPGAHHYVQRGGSGKSLNDAVQEVRRRYPGARIINAETKIQGGREVHHIRVMVNGKVKTETVVGRNRG